MTRTPKLAVVAAGLFVVCGAVALGPLVGAQSDDTYRESTASWFRCSNRTLRGAYGFSIDGTILAGTPNAFLLRGVAMTHFDGHGNLSQVDFTTRNGAPVTPDWRPAVRHLRDQRRLHRHRADHPGRWQPDAEPPAGRRRSRPRGSNHRRRQRDRQRGNQSRLIGSDDLTTPSAARSGSTAAARRAGTRVFPTVNVSATSDED
jgi:hypothetical protein